MDKSHLGRLWIVSALTSLWLNPLVTVGSLVNLLKVCFLVSLLLLVINSQKHIQFLIIDDLLVEFLYGPESTRLRLERDE